MYVGEYEYAIDADGNAIVLTYLKIEGMVQIPGIVTEILVAPKGKDLTGFQFPDSELCLRPRSLLRGC